MMSVLFCENSESSGFVDMFNEHVLRKVREKLKEMGYKSGRISQLVGATRPSSSSGLKRPAAVTEKDEADKPATVLERSVAKNPSSSSGLKRPAAVPEHEACEESDADSWWQAATINALQLPRLRGKQPPTGVWTRISVPAWVQEQLAEPTKRSTVSKTAPPRKAKPFELCKGHSEDEPCVFSVHAIGETARVHPDRHGGQHCLFCSEANLQRAVATAQGKGTMTSAFAFFQENSHEVFQLACSRVERFTDQATLDGCLARLGRLQAKGPTREARGRTAREKQKEREEAQKQNDWKHLLQNRVLQTRVKDRETRQYKESTQKNALRRLSRKFPGVYRPDGSFVRPGVQWRTPLAAAFKQFAEEFSWAMCSSCCRLVPQKFHPKHVRGNGRGRALRRTIKHCKNCAKNVGYKVPQVADIPKPLRKLPQNVLDALAIFRIYTGPHEQGYQAYRVHTGPIRFSWQERSVEDRLTDLPNNDWKRGRTAFEWLRDAEGSAYKDFLAAHHAFLEKRAGEIADGDMDVEEHIKWLPLRFMETVGLECAIWPHLYWDRQMTETWVRSQDTRRQARRRATQRPQEDEEDLLLQAEEAGWALEEEDACGAEEEEQDWTEVGRQSAKASFVAKVFSSVLGYGSCYELQHFVYDLWLSSSLGGAKNASGTTLRGAVAGRVFSPVYWQTMHLALVDCVRQVGLPKLFVTVAPLEASAPYHLWLQDELEKTLRERTQLPAAETFHLAHLLFQVAEGLLTGTNTQNQEKGKSNAWVQHTLSSSSAEEGAQGGGKQMVTEMFARLEFQDGKRRRHTGPSQSYHGSGRTHLHMLVWLKDPEQVPWPQIVRGDLPAGDKEPELRSLVEGSQLDWGHSGWPLQEEETKFAEGHLCLKHPADAHGAHVRAWMPDVLGAMQCHMDVQAGDGRGLLLQYTASYTSKFSDQFATSWLNEEATDYHLARKILSEYLWPHLSKKMFLKSFSR